MAQYRYFRLNDDGFTGKGSVMLNELSATEAASAIAKGEITSEQFVRACLGRIAERDGLLKAWAFLDPDLALSQARARDAAEERLGPLHGVPVGVKDIIDTADMPTGMNSPIYDGYRPRNDAACVALMRKAGAVILGKTVTVEFAGMAPPPTRNPHNPDHTPGGSSSGSAAAVADFHVPAAFGTQTAGSVHRPAAYCGIVGWKPSFDHFNIHGVRAAAQSLDTLGLLTRSVDDAELLGAVLVGREAELGAQPPRPPVIGLCRTHLWQQAKPESVEAVEEACDRLGQAGAEIREFPLPEDFAALSDARNLVSNYERARATSWEFFTHPELLSPQLHASVERGLSVDYRDYAAAIAHAYDCRARLNPLMEGFDALIAPVAEGEAPEGLEATGDHAFVGFWNLLHVPSFALPTAAGPNGLPVGIHLVGAFGNDIALAKTARWVMDRIGKQA